MKITVRYSLYQTIIAKQNNIRACLKLSSSKVINNSIKAKIAKMR